MLMRMRTVATLSSLHQPSHLGAPFFTQIPTTNTTQRPACHPDGSLIVVGELWRDSLGKGRPRTILDVDHLSTYHGEKYSVPAQLLFRHLEVVLLKHDDICNLAFLQRPNLLISS